MPNISLSDTLTVVLPRVGATTISLNKANVEYFVKFAAKQTAVNTFANVKRTDFKSDAEYNEVNKKRVTEWVSDMNAGRVPGSDGDKLTADEWEALRKYRESRDKKSA